MTEWITSARSRVHIVADPELVWGMMAEHARGELS